MTREEMIERYSTELAIMFNDHTVGVWFDMMWDHNKRIADGFGGGSFSKIERASLEKLVTDNPSKNLFIYKKLANFYNVMHLSESRMPHYLEELFL